MVLTDADLTLRLKQDDETAFETLFRRHYRFLYTIAIQYVKDPAIAEDALQEVYLKLWTHRSHLDPSQPVKSYLATAMRNQVLNRLRDEKRTILRHIELQTGLSILDTTTEDQITLDEYSLIVQAGLRHLPQQRRLVFTLRSENGLSNEEIAAQLHISANTVKVQYYQACRFLRNYLRQHAGIETLALFLATYCN
ncbi:RNA polymerase sigma-70 factor [Spirosoma taeanense]|uniref:RNA polymerase sigma-70 factor n=1 Tax=Spirosoma taeanense TaxID=2735870 RepID=A0A6M5YD09_9BACT|nr:RNA polymerase sigma-70 factor [Spirosoma taeanense]QJW91869.1 RNA polymerase sigma-70 factor [Spirosoma taeanense]